MRGPVRFRTVQRIPLLWQRFGPHIGSVPGQIGYTTYGVMEDGDDDGFDYAAAVEVERRRPSTAGVEEHTHPGTDVCRVHARRPYLKLAHDDERAVERLAPGVEADDDSRAVLRTLRRTVRPAERQRRDRNLDPYPKVTIAATDL